MICSCMLTFSSANSTMSWCFGMPAKANHLWLWMCMPIRYSKRAMITTTIPSKNIQMNEQSDDDDQTNELTQTQTHSTAWVYLVHGTSNCTHTHTSHSQLHWICASFNLKHIMIVHSFPFSIQKKNKNCLWFCVVWNWIVLVRMSFSVFFFCFVFDLNQGNSSAFVSTNQVCVDCDAYFDKHHLHIKQDDDVEWLHLASWAHKIEDKAEK